MNSFFRAGKKFKSMKDLMVSSRDSSPVRERAGLSLSAVKSLVLREEKPASESGDKEKLLSLIRLLFDAGRCILAELIKGFSPRINFSYLFIYLLYPLMIFYFHCNICKIFAEGDILRRNFGSDPETLATKVSLPREIHGAPSECLVVKISEVMGNLKTLRKMAIFWCGVVAEVS